MLPEPWLLQSTLEDMDELANIPQPKKRADMNGEVVAKLHLVEKHIRKNKLQVRTSLLLGSVRCAGMIQLRNCLWCSSW